MQLQKRRKKILCSHLSCTKRAQHPPTLCWIHGAKNIVAALTDALKEEFYWVYVPTTVGWCNYADGKDISTESIWKDGLECAGCIRITRPTVMILKAKKVNTMERFGLCSLQGCISVATDGEMCVLHSTTYDDDCVDQNSESKSALFHYGVIQMIRQR
jgi:hypothetical protein